MLFGNDRYGYDCLKQDMEKISSLFNIRLFSIGRSTLGRDLLCMKIGYGPKNVFYNGAHHALEWITAPLLVRFIYDSLTFSQGRKRLASFDINDLFKRTSIHIVPMINPDGVEAVTNPDFITSPLAERIIIFNNGENFTKTWQSNINGVDLNHNYDANFSFGKSVEIKHGIYGPSSTIYSGLFPESEAETKAVCNYVRNNDFKLAMAFHSQGKVIYYDYNGYVPENGYEIVRELGDISGYMPDKASGFASFGGFKDWFIDKFNRPAYTVEVGLGKNPLGIYQYEEIYRDILPLLICGAFLA